MSERGLHDEEAERALLGAVLVSSDRFDDIADGLEAGHFGRYHHQQIFEAMQAVHAKGGAIDWLTVGVELERRRQLEDVGGKAYLASLTDGIPRGANVEHYAGVIRDKALLRSVRDVARRVLTDAESAMLTGTALLEQAESQIYALTSQAVRTDWMSGEQLASELYPALERLQQTREGMTGLSSGFTDLDRMTRGWQDGDLILLGARPSQGKSALALQMAMHAARTVPVALFSIEMSRQQLGLRAVIAEAQIDGWRFLSGRVSDVEMRRAGEAITVLSSARISLDESPNLSPLQARSKLRRLASKVGRLGLVVVDYLQLCAPLPEHRREPRHVQVAGISRAWKILAREFGCPFLVLSQLNRSSEGTQEKRPSMGMLRESGALEQDADLILLLHRPEVYEPQNESLKGAAELIIAKARNGPIGVVDLVFRGPSMTFGSKSRYDA
jgi:replicative DNA helicase